MSSEMPEAFYLGANAEPAAPTPEPGEWPAYKSPLVARAEFEREVTEGVETARAMGEGMLALFDALETAHRDLHATGTLTARLLEALEQIKSEVENPPRKPQVPHREKRGFAWRLVAHDVGQIARKALAPYAPGAPEVQS